MGDEFFTKIAGKIVIDFGCGEGVEAVEMARRGAKRVIGIDIREGVLQAAQTKGGQYGCSKYLSLRIFDEGKCGHRRFRGRL